MAVKHQIAVNADVIDSDYTGKIKVVLANMADSDYQIRNGDQITQLIMQKLVKSDCYEVPTSGKPTRGQQGFRSTSTSKAQICEISAQAFGPFYQRSDTTIGILKYNKKEGRISLASVNISTELAIKSGKYQKQRKLADIVPQEYHGYLDTFEEEQKTKLPPYRPGVDLHIKLEKGQGLPVKENLRHLPVRTGGTLELHQAKRRMRMNKRNLLRWRAPIMFVKKKNRKL